MEKYRTLVIGCGWRGSLHSEAVANHPCFDLVGTCDIDIAKADNIADKYGVDKSARFVSSEEAIKTLKPDVVINGAWPGDRWVIYDQCAENGVRHLVSEKPFAKERAGVLHMKHTAETSDCSLSFTHQRRFSPGNIRIRELLAAGAVGKVTRLDLLAFRHLLDCGVHTLDLVSSYFGEIKVKRVLGALDMKGMVNWFRVPAEGSFNGTLIYDAPEGSLFSGYNNEITASMLVGANMGRPDESGVNIYGTRGFMELGWEGNLFRYFSADMRSELDEHAKLTPGDCESGNIHRMWDYLADVFDSREKDNILDWRHGYYAAEILFALYESVRRGEWIDMDEYEASAATPDERFSPDPFGDILKARS